jgi:hypothetical protein
MRAVALICTCKPTACRRASEWLESRPQSPFPKTCTRTLCALCWRLVWFHGVSAVVVCYCGLRTGRIDRHSRIVHTQALYQNSQTSFMRTVFTHCTSTDQRCCALRDTGKSGVIGRANQRGYTSSDTSTQHATRCPALLFESPWKPYIALHQSQPTRSAYRLLPSREQ